MRTLLQCAGLVCVLFVADASSAHQAASTPRAILQSADRARGHLDGVIWVVHLQATEGDRERSMSFDIKARAFDVLGESLAPSRYRGNKVLMLRQNTWFHKPGLSRPVPISRRQRLLGHAVYGDIASTNYANDYEATMLADEEVDGEACYVFDLRATNDRTTYDRIKYWVSRDRLVGLRAEYFTVSGKLLKTATMEYDNAIEVEGEAQPFISRIRIFETLMSRDVTTLTFEAPRLETLPDYLFDRNLLR